MLSGQALGENKYRQHKLGGSTPRMKVSQAWILSVAIMFGILVFSVWTLLEQPWLFLSTRDVDICNGDTRDQVRVCSLVVQTRIQESALSREVRRLGIGIPQTRTWKRAFEGRLVNTIQTDYYHGSALMWCDTLVHILDQAKAPDDERRIILEKLMATLQTGDAKRTQEEALLLIAEVADKHGLDVFHPEIKDYLTRLAH